VAVNVRRWRLVAALRVVDINIWLGFNILLMVNTGTARSLMDALEVSINRM